MSRASRRLLINFVSDVSARTRSHPLDRLVVPEHGFQPPTDIYETADEIVVRMELAGMNPANIDLSVDESAGWLTVRGRRDDPAASEERRYYKVEIECGPFKRVIQVPRPVASEAATASYDEGFLTVRLPKRESQHGSPRNVPIQ